MNGHSEQLLANLKSGNGKAYQVLYNEYYSSVARLVINNNGTIDDAKDLFQDTLIVLLNKLKKDDFILTASLKTYVIAISKNLWLKTLRNATYRNETSLADYHNNTFFCEIETAILKEKSYWERLQGYLNKVSNHCNHLLQSMFLKNRTIEDIQAEYGYSSKHNAQNQKHKCLQQVRKVKEMQEVG